MICSGFAEGTKIPATICSGLTEGIKISVTVCSGLAEDILDIIGKIPESPTQFCIWK